MPDTLVDLGQRIREERQARQWTLEQFSEKTGLSKSFLSQIERGNAEPSITSLKKIAAQFGYSVVNLFLQMIRSGFTTSDQVQGQGVPRI